MTKKIIAQNDNHLIRLIKKEMKRNGCQCNLNHIDVSKITNMAGLFIDSDFNGNISKWNVEKVEDMTFLFSDSKFNSEISNWKPYSLNSIDIGFFDHPAQVPYWATFENKDERRRAIDAYHLQNELAQELSQNNIQEKRVKL